MTCATCPRQLTASEVDQRFKRCAVCRKAVRNWNGKTSQGIVVKKRHGFVVKVPKPEPRVTESWWIQKTREELHAELVKRFGVS